MFVLISGALWRDPAVRLSKGGKQFVTALVKAGPQGEALWVNFVAFDEAVQAGLLRLKANDALSIQGTGKITIYEKNGEHRASLDVTASHVLPLRQPTKPRKVRQEAETASMTRHLT